MNDLFITGIRINWDEIENNSYLKDIDSINQVNELKFTRNITFFVGENGSGKSTLLEAIAIATGFNPEGGSKNYNFSTYDSHSALYHSIQLIRGYKKEKRGYFLRAESFYNVATKEEYEGMWSEKYHEKSHGESFLELTKNIFTPNGLYLLDEPEAALFPQRQLSLLIEIAECAKNGSQFIIVTHSPILLAIPDSTIYTFDNGPIHPCSYEDTNSYQIMKMFINNKDDFLRRLLK